MKARALQFAGVGPIVGFPYLGQTIANLRALLYVHSMWSRSPAVTLVICRPTILRSMYGC